MESREYQKMHELEKTNWWYCSRRKLLSIFLKKYLSFGSKILDIGCGTGANGLEFSRTYDYAGIDSNPEAIKFSKKTLKDVFLMNAEDLKFKRNSFSAVLCLDVLEHLKNERIVLKNIKNILKEDGVLIVTVPAFMFLWSDHDNVLHHYRRYSQKELELLLSASGFKVLRKTYWNSFLFLPVLLLRKIKSIFSSFSSDLEEAHHLVNGLLTCILNLEAFLISKGIDLPFGVSILLIAKKSK